MTVPKRTIAITFKSYNPHVSSGSYSDSYVLATLRSVGVPAMYLEDALQEVRILEWRTNPVRSKQALRYMAIDALRKLPGYNRRTVKGFVTDGLSPEATEFYARTLATQPYPSDELIDAERAINALSLKRRRAFALLAAGVRPSDVSRRLDLSSTRVVQFKRQLRQAVA